MSHFEISPAVKSIVELIDSYIRSKHGLHLEVRSSDDAFLVFVCSRDNSFFLGSFLDSHSLLTFLKGISSFYGCLSFFNL